jgi:hypothetical protein
LDRLAAIRKLLASFGTTLHHKSIFGARVLKSRRRVSKFMQSAPATVTDACPIAIYVNLDAYVLVPMQGRLLQVPRLVKIAARAF